MTCIYICSLFLIVAVHSLKCSFGFRLYSSRNSLRFSDTMMSTQYDFDVAIIGCGVGGHGAALHARANGLKTAVFTGKDVGGTCVNR